MAQSTLPCPHCQAAIRATAFKGFKGIKQCPSCNGRIRFKKASAKTVWRARWKPFLVFMVLLTVYTAFMLALFGADVPKMLLIVPIAVYMVFQAPKPECLSSFEKDE